MNYTEFVHAVETMINQRKEGGLKATVYTAVKNNDTRRTGVILETPGINLSPTIYLEEFYESYLGGKTINEIVDELLETYEKIKKDESWDYEKIFDFQKVRERIVYRLVNTEKNEQMLQDVPHREILDLSLIYYVLLDASEKGTTAMLISDRHMDQWKTTEKILWSEADRNTRRLLMAECFTMQYAMSELLGAAGKEARREQNLLEREEKGEDKMYVLSNRARSNGAACMIYPYVLRMMGDILEEDFYILPSSIHEVILVPASAGISVAEMEKMVCEINETQVPEEEILGSHVYRYSRKNKTISMGGKAYQVKEETK